MPSPINKKKVVSKPAPVRAVGLQLPTTKTTHSMKLTDHITLWFGQPGVGKTTFVNALADRVLFLSTDRGTRSQHALRQECLDWDQFERVLKALESGQARNYDMVCIDHVDDWAGFAEAHVLEHLRIESLTDAGYGKGWSVYKKTLFMFMARLKALDLGLTFIAHENIKKVKIRGLDVDKCQPQMSKQAWDLIIPLCDIVGHIGMKPIKNATTGKREEIRVLETQPREDLYAKDRTTRKRPADREWEFLDGRKFAATFGVK